LEGAGWTAQIIPFEIGSRGQITGRNKTSILKVIKEFNIKTHTKKLFC
jgi:hypothetical protein